MCKDEEHILPSRLVSKVNRLVQLFSHDTPRNKSRQFPQALRKWGHLIISILPGGEPEVLLANVRACTHLHLFSFEEYVNARRRIHCILHVCHCLLYCRLSPLFKLIAYGRRLPGRTCEPKPCSCGELTTAQRRRGSLCSTFIF